MSAWRVLARKEFLDLWRDRRMLLMTFGLPVITYPALFVLIGVATMFGQSRLKNAQLTIALVGDDLQVFKDGVKAPANTTFIELSKAEAEARLKDKKLAAYVEVPSGTAQTIATHGQVKMRVGYTKRFDESNEGYVRLVPAIEAWKSTLIAERLRGQHLDDAFIAPVLVEAVDVELGSKLGILIASRIIPFLIIVMLVAGAVTAATDVTAGEKERGTYETLLVAPVAPLQVMIAKFSLVATVSVVSAIANVSSMALTFGLGTFATSNVALEIPLEPYLLFVLLLSLSMTALVISGFALALMATAVSTKQAQAMAATFLSVMITPALISTVPGVELSPINAWIPVVGISLLIKATILGAIQTSSAVIALSSSLVLVALGIWTAANVFKSERFRFSGTSPARDALKISRER